MVSRVLQPHRLELGVALVQHGRAFVVTSAFGRGGLKPVSLVDVHCDTAMMPSPRDDLDAAFGACVRACEFGCARACGADRTLERTRQRR